MSLYFILVVCIVYWGKEGVHVCMGAREGQKREKVPLELELQEVISSPMQVLGSEIVLCKSSIHS